MGRASDDEYRDRTSRRLGLSWAQVMESTAELSVRAAGAHLGVPARLIAAERQRLGMASSPTERRDARREQLAREHGYRSWTHMLRQTIDWPGKQVGEVFGFSAQVINDDRIRLGIRDARVAHRFDAADPANRHHGVVGYERGCRCLKCRAGHARLQKARRTRNAQLAGSVEHSHGISGYTNHRCRCDACVSAWAAYKAGYARRAG